MKAILGVGTGLILIGGSLAAFKFWGINESPCILMGLLGASCIAKGLELENLFIDE